MKIISSPTTRLLPGILPALLPVAMLCMALPSLSHADPLDARQIPADAKWVVHVDMDAARGTKVWAALDDQLSKNQDFQSAVGTIEQITGAQFPRDLHDITLYGRSADDQAGVVIVHAKVDRARTLTLLSMNAGYDTKPYGDYHLVTWHDDQKNRPMYGAFKDDSTILIAQTEDLVKSALDVMDGKSAGIRIDSPLAAGAKPQLLAFVAADDLPTLKKKNGQEQSPVIQQMQNAWISLSESDDNAVLDAKVTASDADSAMRLNDLLNGVKAMVAMYSEAKTRNGAEAKAKVVISLLDALTVKREDKTLTLELKVAVARAQAAFDTMNGRKAEAEKQQ